MSPGVWACSCPPSTLNQLCADTVGPVADFLCAGEKNT